MGAKRRQGGQTSAPRLHAKLPPAIVLASSNDGSQQVCPPPHCFSPIDGGANFISRRCRSAIDGGALNAVEKATLNSQTRSAASRDGLGQCCYMHVHMDTHLHHCPDLQPTCVIGGGEDGGCVIPRPRCTIGLCVHHRGRRQAQITFDSGMVATRQMPPHALFHPHLSWGGCDDRYHNAILGSRLGRVCASIGHERGRCPIYRVRTLSLQLLDDARPMSCRVFCPLSRW